MEFKVLLDTKEFVGIKERFNAKEELVFAFESSEYPLDELRVTITDGTFAKRRSVKDAKINITEYCKKACVLEIIVDLMLRGEVAKTWKLEPFVVREDFGAYELIPEIALLRKEIRTMKKVIKELNSKITETM